MTKSISFFVGGVCLALLLNTACVPAGTWEKYNEAGSAAYSEGDYAEAEKQLKAALKKAEEFGPDDPRLATGLNNLALLYKAQGRYAEAERLEVRTKAIRGKHAGKNPAN